MSEKKGSRLCLWAKVNTDPNVSKVKKKFIIKGTGQPADDISFDEYIATVLMYPVVLHIFDGGQDKLETSRKEN